MTAVIYNKKLEELEGDVDDIRADMIGMKHIMQSQEKILVEVKDVLKSQNETLSKVIQLGSDLRTQRDDVDNLKRIFDERKNVTDSNNKMFSEFAAKVKIGFTVAAFFVGIIQGMVVYQYTGLVNDFKDHTKQSTETVEKVKEKLSDLQAQIIRK